MKKNETTAFPITIDNFVYDRGMSLRDYFAAKVMAAMLTGIDSDEKFCRYRNIALEKGISVSEWVAQDAYKQADAMLKQRELCE
jgi:predicted phosphoadenosine phosphosulfate sulfurtransferase